MSALLRRPSSEGLAGGATRFDVPRMPTKLQFVCALETLVRRGLHPRKRAMLLFHRAAPKRTVTMSMLAAHVGYGTFSAANLHYGKLAADLAKYGEFSFPNPRFAISAIGAWDRVPPHPSGQFSFAMHPELAAAIAEVLGPTSTRPRKARGTSKHEPARRIAS